MYIIYAEGSLLLLSSAVLLFFSSDRIPVFWNYENVLFKNLLFIYLFLCILYVFLEFVAKQKIMQRNGIHPVN